MASPAVKVREEPCPADTDWAVILSAIINNKLSLEFSLQDTGPWVWALFQVFSLEAGWRWQRLNSGSRSMCSAVYIKQ